MPTPFIRLTAAHNRQLSIVKVKKISNVFSDEHVVDGKKITVTVLWVSGYVMRVLDTPEAVLAKMQEAMGTPVAPISPTTSSFLTEANTKRLR